MLDTQTVDHNLISFSLIDQIVWFQLRIYPCCTCSTRLIFRNSKSKGYLKDQNFYKKCKAKVEFLGGSITFMNLVIGFGTRSVSTSLVPCSF